MIASKKYRTRSLTRGNQTATPRSGIQRYFRDSRRASLGAIATAPHMQYMDESAPLELSDSPTLPNTLGCFSETPAAFRSTMDSPSLPSSSMPEDLRAILQALPTKADIEALPSKSDIETLILRVEEAHTCDIQEIRAEIQGISDRVDSGESSLTILTQRVSALERTQASQTATAVDLQLHMEDLEDRSRRKNLRLRGLPEATGSEDLEATVVAIFQKVLGTAPPKLELDQVHRTLGPKSPDPDRPRDELCRIHRYTQKDLILRKAWDYGEVEFDGAPIKILPDLSRATLQRRALLRPMLDLAR